MTSVTEYVKEEMNKADRLEDGTRKGTVGFALTALQRRLASSPEAIYQSLKRRRSKLETPGRRRRLRSRGQLAPEHCRKWRTRKTSGNLPIKCSPDEYENFEEAVVDQATAAQTIQELEAEIVILDGLEEQARQLVHSGAGPQVGRAVQAAAEHARDA